MAPHLLGSASFGEQASRFARNMLLTRLLAPSAFGTMAIVMSSSSIVGSLTDVGLRVSVIRNPRGREPAYLNAAWWLAMGRSLGVYAICFVMAPWVARFYGNLELSCVASRGVTERPAGRGDESTVLPTAERHEVRALGCDHQWRRRLWCHSYGDSQLSFFATFGHWQLDIVARTFSGVCYRIFCVLDCPVLGGTEPLLATS